uniref:Uncharacterized protein n=1 Tax=Anguilla anguilla TaxID=7936 RepID=A0A0E9TIY1_ANGAN
MSLEPVCKALRDYLKVHTEQSNGMPVPQIAKVSGSQPRSRGPTVYAGFHSNHNCNPTIFNFSQLGAFSDFTGIIYPLKTTLYQI